MRKFRTKPVTVKATQVTTETFGDSCQNTEHIIGVMYDPRERCAFIQTSHGKRRVEIGDWIIRDADGYLHAWRDEGFRATYEPEEGKYSRSLVVLVNSARSG